MTLNFSQLGQILALTSAVLWAFAVILFRKSTETVHPIALNLFKNFVAIVLILPTMVIFQESLFLNFPLSKYLLFILSGILGMAIADTLFFMSLNRIGASLNAIISCTYSPLIIILSTIFLKETLKFLQIIGAILIILAVLLTAHIKHNKPVSQRRLFIGIILGILSNLATAVGIIIIKPLLNTTPILWATEIRLISGVVSLFLISLLFPNRTQIYNSIKSLKSIGYSLGGTIIGTYLALIIWLAGMKYTTASIASILNQTSSVFIFIFAAIFLKEKISLVRIIAIILAMIGVSLVFIN